MCYNKTNYQIKICGENQTARRELSYESFYICIEAKKSGRIKKVS